MIEFEQQRQENIAKRRKELEEKKGKISKKTSSLKVTKIGKNEKEKEKKEKKKSRPASTNKKKIWKSSSATSIKLKKKKEK